MKRGHDICVCADWYKYKFLHYGDTKVTNVFSISKNLEISIKNIILRGCQRHWSGCCALKPQGGSDGDGGDVGLVVFDLIIYKLKNKNKINKWMKTRNSSPSMSQFESVWWRVVAVELRERLMLLCHTDSHLCNMICSLELAYSVVLYCTEYLLYLKIKINSLPMLLGQANQRKQWWRLGVASSKLRNPRPLHSGWE